MDVYCTGTHGRTIHEHSLFDGFFSSRQGAAVRATAQSLRLGKTWNQPAKTEENQPTGDVFGVKIASEFGETQETINSWLSFLSVFRF